MLKVSKRLVDFTGHLSVVQTTQVFAEIVAGVYNKCNTKFVKLNDNYSVVVFLQLIESM